MEDDDIYDVVTESGRGEKIITPRRSKRGPPMKMEVLICANRTQCRLSGNYWRKEELAKWKTIFNNR